MHDYLVVGAGLWGATFAREKLDRGRTVLVIDRREHVAGNCHTEQRHGITVHAYGPHVFHTRCRRIWDYVNRFAEFNHFRLHGRSRLGDVVYSFPPNLALFQQLWGVTTPAEASEVLARVRAPRERIHSLEDLILDALGEEIYERFYRGYSTKQWGRDPSRIPVAVGRRLPIRMIWCDRWFDAEYEGVPVGGYTPMVTRMLEGADVELGVDFLADRDAWARRARRVVYTGRIDDYFDRCYGELEYRSLTFEHEVLAGDFQGTAVVNYPDAAVPYTRITEHKHLGLARSVATVITREYPHECRPGDVPCYPVESGQSGCRAGKYRKLARATPVVFGGRLAEFRYYDMDQAVAAALKAASAA